jgi:hypothetical protein
MSDKYVTAPSCSLRKAGRGKHSSTVVYPNPFNEGINIHIPDEFNIENNQMQISLTDMQGRTLFNEKISFDFASQSINNFTKKLSEGIYDLHITNSIGKDLVHQQIVKIK